MVSKSSLGNILIELIDEEVLGPNQWQSLRSP
jgi:hypothetical protein